MRLNDETAGHCYRQAQNVAGSLVTDIVGVPTEASLVQGCLQIPTTSNFEYWSIRLDADQGKVGITDCQQSEGVLSTALQVLRRDPGGRK